MVISGCVRFSEHFRNVSLARAQASWTSGELLSLESFEEIVRDHILIDRRNESRALRDIGDYQGEKDVLISMLNSYAAGITVRFQDMEASHFINVHADGASMNPDVKLDGDSIVLVNP